MIVLFICSFFLLLILSYPLTAWLFAQIRSNPVKKDTSFCQPVSIIIACHNEEKFIRKKILSFLDPDEWIEGSEMIIVSNGSTDSTNEILKEFVNNPRVKIIYLHNQSSKIVSVNLAAGIAAHNILLFSDCRQKMKKGSVKALVSNFSDLRVGTVNSTLAESGNTNKLSVRRLLNFISCCESRSGSSLNLFGALYAQRKEVFRKVPEDLLFDDLFVIVSTLAQKKRLVCEKEALIEDIAFDQYYGADRIKRLARGLMIFLNHHSSMIGQLPFSLAFRFLVLKYLKLALPFLLLFLCISLALVLTSPQLYTLMLLSDILLTTSLLFHETRTLLLLFIRVNWNFFISVVLFLFLKKRSNKWNRLPSETEHILEL